MNNSNERKYLIDLLSKQLNTVDASDIFSFSEYLINVLKLDTHSEEFTNTLQDYINNWKFRDVQSNAGNFYLPIEETIFNAIRVKNSYLTIYDKDIFSPKLNETMIMLLNFKSNPGLISFLANKNNRININSIKIQFSTIKNYVENYLKDYKSNNEINLFINDALEFQKKYKYLIKYINTFEFVVENNEIVEKDRKHLRLNKNDLLNLINDLDKLSLELSKIIIDNINKFLNINKK